MLRCNIHCSIVKKLKNQIIVSSQASINEPFYNNEAMKAMVLSVINGGAGGLRLAGKNHINTIRPLTNLPIIGITKPDIIPDNYKEIVYITPTFADAKIIKQAGSDIIAIDATNRSRPDEDLETLIKLIHSKLECPIMADVSNLEEGIKAEELKADIISTTLSGYTTYSKSTSGPDFTLLKNLIEKVNIPVILEGRVETPEEVKKAFEIGAYAVVIGSAITRPQLITKKFVEVAK